MTRPTIAALILSFSLVGQQTGEYSVTGVVLNTQTGEPVKYALVTLMSFQQFDPSQPENSSKIQTSIHRTTQTGGAGEFQFVGLPKAHYTVSAQKPGFNAGFSPETRGSRQVEVTASVSGVQLKLSPLGSIEGKVVDQDDEPLRGVNIVALQMQINDGLRETHSLRSVATDDRGVYRLWNLAPGKYYIEAAGKSGGTYRYVGDGTPYYSSWQSFTPVYFGGGHTLDSAASIQIEVGSKALAHFRLDIEPAFKIRGMLGNAPGSTVAFELLKGSEDVSASRTSLNTTTGRFEVQDVTPGTYLLRVTQEAKMRGETLVTVSDRDVNGVSISLAPAVTVQGITRVMGAPIHMKQMPGFERARVAAGADADVDDADFDQAIESSCNVSLHEIGGGTHNPSAPARRLRPMSGDPESGAFTIADVLPGVYRVSVQCTGGYPTSVLSGGVDLLVNPNLMVQPGVAPAPIEIALKPGGGTLNGELAIHPVPKSAGVLLVPAFSNSTGPVMFPIVPEIAGET